MTHDINDLNTFATAYQDNAPQGDGLCRINWLNGDPGSRTPGHAAGSWTAEILPTPRGRPGTCMVSSHSKVRHRAASIARS